MKRNYLKVGLILLASWLLAACSGSTLPDAEADKYIQLATEVIQQVNHGNWDQILEQSDPQVQEALTQDIQDETDKALAELGELKEVKTSKAAAKDGYIIVATPCQYAKKKIIFTISFNQANDQLVGLYFK